MASKTKLLCNLCLSTEHNTQGCPRLQRNVTPPIMTPKVTLQAPHTALEATTVTLQAFCAGCLEKDDEIDRLAAELAKLKGQNAERQRAYRVKRGNEDQDR